MFVLVCVYFDNSLLVFVFVSFVSAILYVIDLCIKFNFNFIY